MVAFAHDNFGVEAGFVRYLCASLSDNWFTGRYFQKALEVHVIQWAETYFHLSSVFAQK